MDTNIVFIMFILCMIAICIISMIILNNSYKGFEKLIHVDEKDLKNFLTYKYGDGESTKNSKKSNIKIKDLKLYPRSKAESKVINILEKLTGQKFPTAYPPWLVWKGNNLELDGFNGSNIALEFSGPLHTKWYPSIESYDKYFNRIVKDIVKQKLAKKNKVCLIVIDMSLPERHWLSYIQSRLYDCGLHAKPTNYVNKQEYKPYRNLSLEKDLNLCSDMEMTTKL